MQVEVGKSYRFEGSEGQIEVVKVISGDEDGGFVLSNGYVANKERGREVWGSVFYGRLVEIDEFTHLLLTMRDKVRVLLDTAGCAQMAKFMTCGDTWDMLACADYMVERGDLREITEPGTAGQDRVFIRGAMR